MRPYTTNKYISRLMAVLLALTLLLSSVPAVNADEYSGECGSNLTWSFSAGTLTITGSGAMTDYLEDTMAPWYELRSEILRISLPEGLTTIGDLAFYDCDSLTTVVIPDSVESIGYYAFAECGGMEMLDLGSVKTVGECAFSDCVSLKALRLPNSLTTVAQRAFYRCESITTITIPASVTYLGVSSFGYCKSLVNANILASVSTVPDMLFYGCVRLTSVTIGGEAESIGDFAFRGCESLATVYHDGTNMSSAEIRKMVGEDLDSFDSTGYVSEGEFSGTASGGHYWETSDGNVASESTNVTEKENTTISSVITTVHTPEGEMQNASSEIFVTVEGDEGWDDALQLVEDALKSYSDTVTFGGGQPQQAQIHLYAQDSGQVDPEFLNALAGRDVVVTVTTANGSVWRIPCGEMGKEKSNAYDLSYELTAGSAELCEEFGSNEIFVLRFLTPAEVNAEVMIPVGASRSGQNASLFKQKDRIQNVVVDREGYAHFYLASVDEQTEYYIAMNLVVEDNDTIVPDEMLNYYGNPIRTSPLEYEITGRKSSWNMSLNQVTWIMVAVFGFCIITVGIVMFMLNKRKLKMGYVPDLEEDEE